LDEKEARSMWETSGKAAGVDSAHRLRVLVVDADRQALGELAVTLKKAGCDVIESESFRHALTVLANESPELVVVDIRLGEFNGLHLLLRIRSLGLSIPGLITSPFPDAVLEAEARRLGAAFMVKPLKPREVVPAIAALIEATVEPVGWMSIERRQAERRRTTVPGFSPERRVADRRNPQGGRPQGRS
jgi:two-component system response regulator RegA